MNQTLQEHKRKFLAIGASLLIVVICVALRWRGAMPPFDDAYHFKRITHPAILQFDPDRGERGAFTPWPPLYDLLARTIFLVFGGVNLLPPIFFGLFAGGWCSGARSGRRPVAGSGHRYTFGLALAFSPYLIEISRRGHIDHHFVEPLLLILILAGVTAERPLFLGVAMAAALLVQPALIIAAGAAFIAAFLWGTRRMSNAFALAAAIVIAYRLTRLHGYPDSAWFLGYPHAGLLLGAAIACAIPRKPLALAAGAVTALAFPGVLDGFRFLAGDPWLRSIVEFQPMFSSRGTIGTDLANLTGGAFLIPLIARRHRTLALFAIIYLLLALSSRRFLVTAIPLFAIAGATAAANAKRPLILAAITVLPPMIFTIATIHHPPSSDEGYQRLAEDMRPLPRGRVLGPWSFGHPIDVIGQKPVIIDNFGSMPDPMVFQNAIDAMLVTRPEVLLAYADSRDVRYLVLPHPAYLPAVAATVGLDESYYANTPLARRTVWSRLYSGERIPQFTLVRDGSVRVWRIEMREWSLGHEVTESRQPRDLVTP